MFIYVHMYNMYVITHAYIYLFQSLFHLISVAFNGFLKLRIPSFLNLSSSVSMILWLHENCHLLSLNFSPLPSLLYKVLSLLHLCPLHAEISQNAIQILFSLSHGLDKSPHTKPPNPVSLAELETISNCDWNVL